MTMPVVQQQRLVGVLLPWLVACIGPAVVVVDGYNNGVGLTPPMGWNSWNKFNCDIEESLIKDIAQSLIDLKLDTYGYQYINLDDCWQVSRNDTGYIQEDIAKFPSGIGSLSSYVHSLGLKFGLYSDAGMFTCQRRPGGLGHEIRDAQSYNEWQVDYLKYDNCFAMGDIHIRYQRMHDALNASGRAIFFSMCEWGVEDPATWAPPVGNSWRTTYDISPTWDSITSILDLNDRWHAYAGPGGWNDPDMLEVGNGDLTIAEQRSHFTLWCLIKAPLLLGNDLRNMSTDVLNIITNTEVIALNQDPLGVQGYKRSSKTVKKASHTIRRGDDAQEYNNADDDGTVEVWAGELAGGDVAVVLFNRSTQPQKITAHFDEVGLVGPGSTTEDNNEERTTSFGAANVRDLWAHQDLGVYEKSFTATVDSHGVVALRLTPVTRDQISIA